ncbi:MAG: hypothetical protein KAJ53_10715 [Anaerolineales bacterium]|nr:hypothetical protein [Anaerolineales bacterium]
MRFKCGHVNRLNLKGPTWVAIALRPDDLGVHLLWNFSDRWKCPYWNRGCFYRLLLSLLARHSTALIAYFEGTVLPPPAPQLISPIDGEVMLNDPPAFRWALVGVDPIYEIEISASPDFNELSAGGTTSTPTFTPGSPLGGGTYYWRVRATTTAGTGDWSQVWSFQINWRVLVPLILSSR